MRGSSVHINFKTPDGKTTECAGIRFNDYFYVVPKDVLAGVKYVRDISGVRIFRKKEQHDLREFKAVTFYNQKDECVVQILEKSSIDADKERDVE